VKSFWDLVRCNRGGGVASGLSKVEIPEMHD
jgi:hypothetical protein